MAIFFIGSLSGGDRWIAIGLSRYLVEKLIRTPDLRPVATGQVNERLMSVLSKKSKGPAWLPASAQRKIGHRLDADLILTGLAGSSGNRDAAKHFLDELSIVPAETPEGSGDLDGRKTHRYPPRHTVSWAFAEGSRDGFFERTDEAHDHWQRCRC